MTHSRLQRSAILVVDDDADMRALLQAGLQLQGYDVDTACDGVEALQQLGTRRYDALLTDLNMPEMNGAELADAVRAQAGTARLPILLMSADFGRGARPQASADACIAKPFDMQQLAQVLDTLRIGTRPRRRVSPAPAPRPARASAAS